jgi:hypothetical protein
MSPQKNEWAGGPELEKDLSAATPRVVCLGLTKILIFKDEENDEKILKYCFCDTYRAGGLGATRRRSGWRKGSARSRSCGGCRWRFGQIEKFRLVFGYV